MPPTEHADETTNRTNPAADLDTVVIDPDDVIEMLRRHDRDKNEQRSHTLRVTPPLDGERPASLHVRQDGAHYPPEMDPTPLHLNARTLFRDESGMVPNFIWYPDWTEERGRFREEYDVDEDADLDDDERWDEWWDLAVEVWEDTVRDHLPEQITLHAAYPETENATVAVRYESEGEAADE